MDIIWIDLTDPAFLNPLLLTLKVAGFATLFALIIGVAAAFALARRSFFGRDFVDAVCTLPMVMPPTVLGYYLLVFIGRRGVLGHWLMDTFGISLMFTWQGATIAATVVAFPLVFKSARAALEDVGAHYENAARTLGQNGIGRLPSRLTSVGIQGSTLRRHARICPRHG